MLVSLSWKNIWRNKTRSMVIIFAIVFGVIGGVGFVSFFNGLIHQRIQIAIGNEVSNIQIHNPDFSENKDINDTIPNMAGITAVLDTLHSIRGFTSRLKLVSMVNSANNNLGIMVNAIDPAAESRVTQIHSRIIAGTYLTGKRRNEMVIGQRMADKLNVRLHSKVVLTLETPTGNITSAAYRITGIYKTENSTFDEHNAFVKRQDMISLLGINPLTSHEIAIAVSDDHQTPAIVSSLQHIFRNQRVVVEPWNEIMPELGLLTEATNYMLYIFMSIIFLALSFGIINTMLMAVLDRVREIGMLMAIGMNHRKIFLMIMLETILLLLTGSLIGLFLSYGIISYFWKYGIDLSSLQSGLSGMGFSSVVYPFLEWPSYIKIVCMVLIVGILSSIIPARKALKLNPSDAIRKL